MSASSSAVFGDRRGARAALLVAGLCAVGLVLTWVLEALVPATHTRDAVLLYDFVRHDRPIVAVPLSVLLALLEPWFFTVWGIVLVTVCLRQGRRRMAAVVALVLCVAPGSAELLKPLLAHPHAQVVPIYIKDASWPSGHATAATALMWCALLVERPARRLPLALFGAGFLLAVGVALLVLAWHMPSDVLGGYLLGTMWAALAVAHLRASGLKDDLQPAPHGPSRSPPASDDRRYGHLAPIATPSLIQIAARTPHSRRDRG